MTHWTSVQTRLILLVFSMAANVILLTPAYAVGVLVVVALIFTPVGVIASPLAIAIGVLVLGGPGLISALVVRRLKMDAIGMSPYGVFLGAAAAGISWVCAVELRHWHHNSRDVALATLPLDLLMTPDDSLKPFLVFVLSIGAVAGSFWPNRGDQR